MTKNLGWTMSLYHYKSSLLLVGVHGIGGNFDLLLTFSGKFCSTSLAMDAINGKYFAFLETKLSIDTWIQSFQIHPNHLIGQLHWIETITISCNFPMLSLITRQTYEKQVKLWEQQQRKIRVSPVFLHYPGVYCKCVILSMSLHTLVWVKRMWTS